MISRKAVSLFAGGGLVVTIGLYAGLRPVETPPRMVVNPTPLETSYLLPLPEPPPLERAPATISAPPPVATVAKPKPIIPAPMPTESAAPRECALGARPLGDCNCYDEALGKVSLRAHPSDACVEEESRRLGHRVWVSQGDGHFELAGIAGEAKGEASAVSKEGKETAAPEPPPPLLTASDDENSLLANPAVAKLLKEHPENQHVIESWVKQESHFHYEAPAKMPDAIVMARCWIPGHDVHIWLSDGTMLHIRRGTPLAPALALAQKLILSGATYDAQATIYAGYVALYDRSGNKAVNLTSPYNFPNLMGVPGFEPYGVAMNNPPPVTAPAPVAAPAPAGPPTSVASPSSPPPVPPSHKPKGGILDPLAKAGG